MRYVGNLRKENKDYMNMPNDRAVFPPGSIVPDMAMENSEMYRAGNRNTNQMQSNNAGNMRGYNQDNSGNYQMNHEDDMMGNSRDNSINYQSDDMRNNREGDNDTSFPLKSGDVLRRDDMRTKMPQNTNTDQNLYNNAERQINPPMNFNGNMGFIYKSPSQRGCAPSRSVNDFLCEYMGKYISAEFLFGADTYVKKSGILTGMGMNYIVLDINGSTVLCDLTDAKFINISTNDLI